jgi:hypothetical protein
MIDVFSYVLMGSVLGALAYSGYVFYWQRREGGRVEFKWYSMFGLLLSLVVDFVCVPVLNVPGAVPLVLHGLGSWYVFLSSFTFAVFSNLLLSLPLAYFCSRASVNAGRGRTGFVGFVARRTADLGQMRNPVSKKSKRYWLLVGLLLALIPSGFVYAAFQYQLTISTHGVIISRDFNFFSDQACTNEVTVIDWGQAGAGDLVTMQLYMKSTLKDPVTASLAVGNFVPASGQAYLACTWNYNGAAVSSGQVVPVTFTLTVANTITGISSFGFDIQVNVAG